MKNSSFNILAIEKLKITRNRRHYNFHVKTECANGDRNNQLKVTTHIWVAKSKKPQHIMHLRYNKNVYFYNFPQNGIKTFESLFN